MRSLPLRWSSAVFALLIAPVPAQDQDPAKLLKSKDEQERIDAIEQLQNQGGDKAEKLLIGALKDRDWEVIERAVQALAVRGTEDSLKPLLDLVQTGEILRLRVRAADTLARIAPQPAAEALAREARGRDGLRAIEGLARMSFTVANDAMRKGLEVGFEAEELPARVAAARGLPAYAMDAQLEKLTALLKQPVVIGAAALDGVMARPDPRHLGPILARLAEDAVNDVLERRLIAAALGIVEQAKDPAAAADLVRPVLEAVAAAPVAARPGLIRLVGLLGKPGAEPETAPRKEDNEDEDGAEDEARPALVAPDTVRAALLPALSHDDESVRAATVQALQRVGGDDAIEAVRKAAATDASARVRLTALTAAVQMTSAEDPATFDLLTGRLSQDSSTRVREDAAVHLGAFGLADAVPSLIQALQDAEWPVVVAAAVSLGKTRDAAHALAPLTALYEDKDWKKSGAAVVGLGWLHDKAAVPTLIDALGSRSASVRLAAYGFLDRMTVETVPMRKAAWSSWWKDNEATFTFVDREAAARQAQRYGYAPTGIGVYEDLDVLVFQSRGDHIEQLLTALGVKHRLTQLGQVAEAGTQPFGIYVANCTGEAQPEDLEQVAWFVRVGGYLFGSCWALEHHIAQVYPGVVKRLPTGGQVLDNVIAEPCPTDSALLQGVFDGITRPVYRLEGSFLIQVLDPERVEVLIDSPAAATHWGGGNLACWFRAGHGVILDSANHFDLQGLEKIEGLKKPQERMAWAMDHMGLDYDALRYFSDKKVWGNAKRANEEVRDLSAFRFITNFVRQKRRHDR